MISRKSHFISEHLYWVLDLNGEATSDAKSKKNISKSEKQSTTLIYFETKAVQTAINLDFF